MRLPFLLAASLCLTAPDPVRGARADGVAAAAEHWAFQKISVNDVPAGEGQIDMFLSDTLRVQLSLIHI